LTITWPCVFNSQLPQLVRQPRGPLLCVRGVPTALQPLSVLRLRQAASPPATALHGDGQHHRDVYASLHLHRISWRGGCQSAGLPAQGQLSWSRRRRRDWTCGQPSPAGVDAPAARKWLRIRRARRVRGRKEVRHAHCGAAGGGGGDGVLSGRRAALSVEIGPSISPCACTTLTLNRTHYALDSIRLIGCPWPGYLFVSARLE